MDGRDDRLASEYSAQVLAGLLDLGVANSFPNWDASLNLAPPSSPSLSASYSSSNVIVHGQHHSCNGFATMFIVHVCAARVHAAWIDGIELF